MTFIVAANFIVCCGTQSVVEKEACVQLHVLCYNWSVYYETRGSSIQTFHNLEGSKRVANVKYRSPHRKNGMSLYRN